jgi:hypothetical protein
MIVDISKHELVHSRGGERTDTRWRVANAATIRHERRARTADAKLPRDGDDVARRISRNREDHDVRRSEPGVAANKQLTSLPNNSELPCSANRIL